MSKRNILLGETSSENIKAIEENISTLFESKVDKPTGHSDLTRAYVTFADNTQGMVDLASFLKPSSLLWRDSEGRAQVANPISCLDITNKQYVDMQIYLIRELLEDLDIAHSASKLAELEEAVGIIQQNDNTQDRTLNEVQASLLTKYELPENGIPIEDLESKVRTSLTLALSAVQPRTLTETLNNYVLSSTLASANGVATLDDNKKLLASQLPTIIYSFLNFNDFPEEGEVGKLYIATDTNLIYHWVVDRYVELSKSLELGETKETAYAGNKGKQNADNIKQLQTSLSEYTASTENNFANVQSSLEQFTTQVSNLSDTESKHYSELTTKDGVQDILISTAQTLAESKYLKPDDGIPTDDIADYAITANKLAIESITDHQISPSANIQQSKIAGLAAALDAKAPLSELSKYLQLTGGDITGELTVAQLLTASLGIKLPKDNSILVTTEAGDTKLSLPTTTGTVALTSDITSAIETLVGSAPGTLDTLQELSKALADDPNFATTITDKISAKADLTKVNELLEAKADATNLTAEEVRAKAEEAKLSTSIDELKEKSAAKLEMSLDPDSYQLTATLKSSADTTLSTTSFDLPIETDFKDARYDAEGKQLVFTTNDGTEKNVKLDALIADAAPQKELDTLRQQIETETTERKADISTINSELTKKINLSALADVATSGSYNDLTDLPTAETFKALTYEEQILTPEQQAQVKANLGIDDKPTSSFVRKYISNSSLSKVLSDTQVKITVADKDITSDCHVELYPVDAQTEAYIGAHLSSNILDISTGQFSFLLDTETVESVPELNLYYIIQEMGELSGSLAGTSEANPILVSNEDQLFDLFIQSNIGKVFKWTGADTSKYKQGEYYKVKEIVD